MNAAQITHIFWKEYRTQRSIWAGLLVIIASIELLIGFLLRDGHGSLFRFLFMFGTGLSICYALASVGVMFAGEHEENTFNWLRTLPVNRLSLFSGKLLWLAFSWVAAILVIALVAWLPDIGVQSNNTSRQMSSNGYQALMDWGTITGSLLTCGFLFSLTFKRVYAALIVSVVAYFPFMWPLYFNDYSWWYIAVYGCVLLATVVQGSRWLYPQPFLDNLSVRLPESTYSLDRALASPAAPSLFAKVVRRHVWLEWQNARWLALGLAVAPILFMLAFERQLAFFWNCVLLLGLGPLACGLGTCRAEQQQERYRFQANLGVSPGLLWGIKHLVWGGIYLSLLVVYSAVLYVWLTATRQGSEILSSIVGAETIYPHFNRYAESLWPVTWLALSFTFCLYAIGHVFSLLNKRAIAAGLFSFVCACGVILLTRIALLLDVSLLVALVFPAGLIMLFSYVRTADWLIDRNELRDKQRLTGALVVLGLMCVTSWAVWRIAELADYSLFNQLNATISALVPALAFPLFYMEWDPWLAIGAFAMTTVAIAAVLWRCRTWRGVAVGYGILHVLIGTTLVTHFTVTARRMSEAMAHPAEPWPAPDNEAVITGELYRSAEQDVVGVMAAGVDLGNMQTISHLLTGEEEVTDESWAWLDQNADVVQRLREISTRENCSPPEPYQPWSRGGLPSSDYVQLGNETLLLLRLNALRAEREGRLADAWTSHLANMRMFRHMLQWQTPFTHAGISQRFTGSSGLQFDFHRWIDHSDQTSELLAKAAEDLDSVFRTLPGLEDAYHLQARSQVKSLIDGDVANWSRTRGGADPGRGLLFLLNELPWERQRAISITGVFSSNLAITARSIYQGHDTYGDEIAASLTRPFREQSFSHYNVVPLWERGPDPYRVRLLQEQWRLADTTPLIMASYEEPIDDYGIGPVRNPFPLIEEVNLVRQRRLLSLHLALRIAEVSRDEPLRANWLKAMDDVRTTEAGASVLDRAEEREGKHFTQQREGLTRLRRYLLYYDPVTGALFAQSTIDHWGR